MVTLEKTEIDHTEQAEQILLANVDPNWNPKFGNMIIGVTGKHHVYYTLWKYSPINRFNQLTYLGNLSTDILEAAKKAKKISGIQPIYFDSYENLEGMKGSATDVITFGKYRGKTIGEIYIDDPQYVIWLSKNMTPRNEKQKVQEEMAKELTADYFRALGEKNCKEDTKKYVGKINEKVEITLKITNTIMVDNYYGGISFKIRGENEEGRFQFYPSVKSVAKSLGINIKFDYIRTNYHLNEVISKETLSKLNVALETLENTKITIKAKIKGHKEIVGKKFTILNYVKF